MQTMSTSKAGILQGKIRAKRAIACMLIACFLMTLCPVMSASAEKIGKVTAEELNIRKSASPDSEKLFCVKEGARLTILGTKGKWLKVRYGKITGYVMKTYVSVGDSADSAKSSGSDKSSSSSKSSDSAKSSGSTSKKTGSIASLGSAPKTSKPGDKGNHVTKLQKALTAAGYYNGRISGSYGDLTEKAVKAFQKAKGLSVTGAAGSGTIKALFGASASNSASAGSEKIKTEKPNWFKGGDSLIPKNAVFTVKDVRSGRTFQVRRWSGGNHIDAEPINASETATMKKCFGGNWSWERRPVLLKYNGHVYAASMNGMPHSEHDTTPNNNFDGVFCIHFYKSKTHGTDRVDPAHQAAVAEAAKATW